MSKVQRKNTANRSVIRVRIRRFYQDDKVTLGSLQIEGVDHSPIFTLENPWVNNETDVSCIPSGVYQCKYFNGQIYKRSYHVRGVPGRSAILIHVGNYPSNTRGCILPGCGIETVISEYMVTYSKMAMNRLRAILGRENFILEITDNFKE